LWKIAFDDCPNGIQADTEVHMDEDVAHAADLPPRDARVRMSIILRKSTYSFSNDL